MPTDNPPLKTYDEFLATAKTLVAKGGVQAAIWPAPTAEFYQPWFDFYPLFIAQSGGKQLVEGGEPQFTSPEGLAVANFWKSLYDAKLAPNEAYQGDSFADQKAAMAIVGPWAIAVYGGKVDWGAVPVPTKDGMDAKDVHTFSDEKSIGMYTSCKNRGTAWEFLKFATSKDNDGQLLDADRPDADARPMSWPASRTTSRRTPSTSSSPMRPAARSRCRSCRTRSRCGRPSAPRTASR